MWYTKHPAVATPSSLSLSNDNECRAGLCTAAGLAAGGEVWARHSESSCRLLPWLGGLCGGLHGALLPRAGQGQGTHHQRHQVGTPPKAAR